MNDLETIKYIKKNYGDFIENAAGLNKVRASVLAGIMMRETRGGLSSLLSQPGPGGKGDKDKNGVYHGHGLMQIDDRSFPVFTSGLSWSNPDENIKFGADVLYRKIYFFERRSEHLMLLPEWNIERLGIAAYNCGEGNVLKAVNLGKNPDLATAGGNYSNEVLRFAVLYEKGLENAPKAV
jgi:hypothetical protein